MAEDGKLKIGLGLCLTSRQAGAVGWSLSDGGSLVPRWFDSMMRVGMMGTRRFYLALQKFFQPLQRSMNSPILCHSCSNPQRKAVEAEEKWSGTDVLMAQFLDHRSR